MSLEFTKSKNNYSICVWNSHYIHSSYDPLKEAKRFVDGLEIEKNIDYVIFLAPFGGYCNDYLKERFPQIVIIVIEYFQNMEFRLPAWDYCFYLYEENLGQKLFQIIGEEGSLCTKVISWPTSERFFQNETKESLKNIQTFFNTSRDVLGTRMYFSKKWNKNAFRNMSLAKHIVKIEKTTKPICIIASGPSLKKNLPFLIQNKHNCIIIALSSALSVLVAHGIEPDYCVSTDGGFWAKMHLRGYADRCKNTVFIVSLEASLPYSVLKNNFIHFIDYGDGLSHFILQNTKIDSVHALRCGTVSGTAISFAQKIGENALFLFGLDLSVEKSFSHSQPNALELYNESFDFRLKTKNDRIIKAGFQSKGSLLIYENWFKNIPKPKHPLYRIKPKNYSFSNTFSNIRDIDIETAENLFLEKMPTLHTISKKMQKPLLTHLKQSIVDSIATISQLENTKGRDYPSNIDLLLKEISLKEFLQYNKDPKEIQFLALKNAAIEFLTDCLFYYK